jgi:cytochrome c-type biogenesis protein CcmE
MKQQSEIQGNYFTYTSIIILLLIVALLLTPSALATYTLDNSSVWITTTNAWATTNPATLSYTAGSGSTVMVLGIVTAGAVYRTTGTPTFNGRNFTSLGRNMYTSNPSGSAELWYLILKSSDTGSAHTVSVPNAATSRSINFHVATFKASTGKTSILNINGSKNAFGTNPFLSITTTAPSVMVAELFTGLKKLPTVTTPGTELFNNYPVNPDSYGGAFQYYFKTNTGAQDLGWTIGNPSNDYALLSAAFSETPAMNITANGNNVTNNNSLSLTVNQSVAVNFNMTTNLTINSHTDTLTGSGITENSNSTVGYFHQANITFADYGTQYVKIEVFNTTGGYDSRNWTITVNDVTAPGQVTNLTNSTPPTYDTIHLIWDAVTDNLGGSGIKDYLIFIRNNSINWLTIPRDTIDASTSHGNYTDAYQYNARLAVPVSCSYSTCHPNLTTPTHYPFYLKYDATYLYMQAMVADNDTGGSDDYIEIVLDPSKDGGTAPRSDDRYYEFWEDGTTINTFQGNNTTGWENYTSSAVWSVKRYTTPDNPNISGNMFEIRIPLSEIGSPVNDSTVRFAIEHECNEGAADSATWLSKASYLPDTANDIIPDTWTLLFTYRNNTVWDNIGSSTTNSYEATGLLPLFRYYFSVLARDIVLNYGLSATKTLTTSDAPGYDISGYVTSAGIPINNANINTGQYIVHSDANGFYTLNDLINGTYILTVDASGFMGNSTNVTVSGANRFNVNITLQDLTPPSVISNTNNFIVSNGSFLILNASITDAYSGVKNATVNVSPVNSTINEAILTFSGGYWINTTIIADRGETVGVMNLTITTYDNSSNVNMDVNMTAGIDDTAPIVTSNTNSLYVSNGSFLTLDASIMDAFSGVKNATVNVSSVNSTINEAILTLSGDYWINNTIIADNGENTGFKNLTITAYDNAGNVNKSINMTVWINPRLEIIDWSNNITNDQNLNNTIFIDDSIRFNVTANQNVTYNWFYNDTDQLINDNNFVNQFPTTGSYYVYAIVSNSDSTVNKNWTINVVYKPDLVMTMENISFSYVPSEVENGEVKENENVTINVTVYNGGLGDASNINVSFYDGSPGTGNNIANTTITNISAGSSQNATIYWNSIIGTHNISIKVDPENTLVETDDSNNIASKNINVSAWQKYYGNVSGNLSLRDNNGNSMTNWYWATPQGNIFISNNSLIDYSNLQALGRKKDGNVSLNNFGRADELLNMTPGSRNATGFFNNNITMLFSSNGTTPRNYTNFTVYGRKIENVAIFNSTNTANFNSVETSTFITGILWDTSKDDGDGEYGDDSEDIVFISGINVNKTGLGKSSHDYEIAVPSVIRSEGNVYFFVELK